MEKLLTPPPPSVSLNFTSFSHTVGCMLLASFNKNVNFSYVLEINTFCNFERNILWHFFKLDPPAQVGQF